MKKSIALILVIVMAVALTGVLSVSADEYEHVLFINRDGILFNGDVGGLIAAHSGVDEMEVGDYIGGTIEISGWCVTDVEIQQYGYIVDDGEFVPSDYVNTVEADVNAIRAQMSKFEDAVDAARFWVKVPVEYGEHTIEVYLKTDDDYDLLWTVYTDGGVDPNATPAPTKAPTEAPATAEPTAEPTEAPTEVPTDAPVVTEKADNSKDTAKKGNTALIVGIIVGVVAVAVIVSAVILAKRKKK